MATELDPNRRTNIPGPLIALAGWLVPGAGYWLIGERARAMVVFVSIVTLYVMGLLIAGVRVVEVPGYGKHGYQLQLVARQVRDGMMETVVDPTSAEQEANPADESNEISEGWVLKRRFLSEIANKPWFAGQVLAGPLSLLSAKASNQAARAGLPRPHAPLENIGTLYTAVAGMLNLFIIIDSTYRATGGGANAEQE
ncbi:MAG TPA: DUF6677 family protein [Tepidisphaeraceae bacterium]|jgi:hypothetical protein